MFFFFFSPLAPFYSKVLIQSRPFCFSRRVFSLLSHIGSPLNFLTSFFSCLVHFNDSWAWVSSTTVFLWGATLFDITGLWSSLVCICIHAYILFIPISHIFDWVYLHCSICICAWSLPFCSRKNFSSQGLPPNR